MLVYTHKKIKIVLLVLFFIIPSFICVAQSQQLNYTPIAPIPDIYGPSQTVDTKSGVPTLINNIFKTGVGLCTALAVLMIIYGGFKYISSEGFGQKSDAKDIISHALLGLLLALCIYLILFSVNQSLLSTDLFKDLSSSSAH